MSGKPIIPRARARQDVEDAVDWYIAQHAPDAALRLIDSLEQAFVFIADRPAAGSPRHGEALDIPGLRSWKLEDFPYLFFYIETVACIDVWRVLHERQDVPDKLA